MHLVGFIIKKFVAMHGHVNVKLVHLVGFIIKKFVAMHGHMKVKFILDMLRTSNCSSSGGALHKQFTVFHHAS